MIDSVYKKSYPKVFLEKYKYIVKEKKISKIMIYIDISDDSDEENSHDKILIKKNQICNFYKKKKMKKNIRNCFSFLKLISFFLSLEPESFISQNIRKAFSGKITRVF